jgi:hypothetical protein
LSGETWLLGARGRDALDASFAKEDADILLVASGLDQNVEHLALIIDAAPQIHLLTGDRDKDLVEMPSSGWPRTPGAEPPRVDWTEMRYSSTDRLVGDDDPALGEEILDIPEAECEAQVQPNGVLDDGWRELITAVAQCLHRQRLLAVRDHGHGSSLVVTNPSIALRRFSPSTLRSAAQRSPVGIAVEHRGPSKKEPWAPVTALVAEIAASC